MPIQGKITVTLPINHLRNLAKGSVGYLLPHQIIVTEKALFAFLGTQFFTKEECRDMPSVKITRIGTGITHEDFDFDFSNHNKEQLVFEMESMEAYDELFGDSHYLMIPLSPDDLAIIQEFNPSEREKLEQALSQAKIDEEWLLVGELETKLAALEKATEAKK